MARYFEFAKHGTTFRKEIIAGITTFLAMAYILFVNPNMLSGGELPPDVKQGMIDAGISFPSFSAVFTATAVAAIIGSLIMGIFAKYPIALAPGMGLNAFFTYSVVIGMGIPWQNALAAVFISGIVFIFLTMFKIRETIINAIPPVLKHAAAAGIGLFIAFIGLKNAGIVVANPVTFVELGSFQSKETLLAIFGIVITALLMTRKLNGAIFYGMIITTVVGIIVGIINGPSGVVDTPAAPETFGALFDPLFSSDFFTKDMLIVILTFLFVDFFDTAGTLVGVASQAGFMKDGKLPRAGKALASDSVATVAGAVMGTSTTTSYIESSAGVGAGGRTGFTAVIVAGCFFLAMFFEPLLSVVTPQVTAPALIIVGALMASNLAKIAWEQLEEAIPAFLTIITMPLTYSIATGIALGFILYPLTKVVKGEAKKVHWIMYLLFFVFLFYFIWLRE
ncbi:NCS2 family permease [Marinicrinis sediminis]|uniref:NCS2 family permease n=1 Tax=Marinicrinis sediminis TaxID=1652465 RepID=A0ABW5RGG9_9BACL